MRTFTRGRAHGSPRGLLWLAWFAPAVLAGGCLTKKPPEQHFFDQHVQPILKSFCVGNTSPCHAVDPATGTALGNLDLTSYDGIQKRRDVLRTYGSYPDPLLLLKALPEASVSIPYQGTLYTSEIRHAGGKPIDPGSDAFYELKRWLDNGANRDGIALAETGKTGIGACNTGLPPANRRYPVDTTMSGYQTFVSTIQPFLLETCAYGTCHSSPQADFYLTCGSDDEQLAFNYGQVAGLVVPAPTAIEQSEILLRPLSPQAGGVSHTGGVFFKSRLDATWKMLHDWAVTVQTEQPLGALPKSPGQMFFEANVMPKLLQRGCALEGCHSPDGFNDLRIRSGTNGAFSPMALRRNYETVADEFMAFDTVDVRQSRAVKKNIKPESGGITHRAGPILEDADSVATPCPQPFDPATNTRAFCVFQEWHKIERGDRAAAVSAMAATLPLAFISRPPNPDTLLEFDTFETGADLKLADAAVDATGAVTGVTNIRSALGGCAGLTAGSADVRGPEWSYDGSKLIFAGRASASVGLDLYMIDVGGGGGCTRLTNDNGAMSASGVRTHNFDPVFAPDGSVVFASTRAGTWTLYKALPNSNLYRVGPNLDFSTANVQQMTFLLNSEISPAFMQDGRVSMTTEKVEPLDPSMPNGAVFYQLAGRRINWDLSDYHPLLAQRSQSTDTFSMALQPSVDFQQATEIREGLDRNFLIILSDDGAKGGGGALATFNRSVGPFQSDRTEVTFVRSVKIIDPAATGKAGTTGVYRSPFSLPNGEILASYDGAVTDPAAGMPHYALVAVNEQTGAHRMLAADGTLSYVEAALGYKRGERLLFSNLPQLVFGGHEDSSTGSAATMHFPDGPVLATLLGANLRRGRNVQAMDRAVALRVYEEMAPTSKPTPGTFSGTQSKIGQASFESDHSLKVLIPASKPLILEFIDGGGNSVLRMTEEHQVTPGEYITPGPPRALFNNICAGCHGSLSGSELDIAVSADALTGASVSLSRNSSPKSLQ